MANTETITFPEGFYKGVTMILENCRDNNTDNATLELDVDDNHHLLMDIQFRIIEEEWANDTDTSK